MAFKALRLALDMDIKSLISTRIRELRESKNLTQEQLAWKAEIDRTYMNHIEGGKRNISIETLNKIIQALEISFLEFFTSESFQEPKRQNT